MNKFSILREESSVDDFYETGPWTTGDRYLEPTIEERLHREILDIEQWLQPTPDEMRIRLLTIRRFSAVIEATYPGCYVIPQGSSATNTYLPTSDIDLIIMNLPEDEDPVIVIRTLAKVFTKSKMISNSLVLAHARVPIAKLIERPFGFHMDLCASNINGSLNIPRVRNVLDESPLLRPILMFFKLFVWAFAIDDPATGGFGSNWLLNFVHFGVQSRPDITNLGVMLVYLLDVVARRLNHHVVGISTTNGGFLFPKEVNTNCPEAFVIEDPQFHDNMLGTRTSAIGKFKDACAEALDCIRTYDYTKASAISSFLPDTNQLEARRSEMERFVEYWKGDPGRFSRVVSSVPTHVKFSAAGGSKNQKTKPAKPAIVATPTPTKKKATKASKPSKPKRQVEEDEWDNVLSKAKAKQLRKEQKLAQKAAKKSDMMIIKSEAKKHAKQQKQRGGASVAGGNFKGFWDTINAACAARKEQGRRQRMRDNSPRRFNR